MEKISQFGKDYIEKRLRAGQSLEVIKMRLSERLSVATLQLNNFAIKQGNKQKSKLEHIERLRIGIARRQEIQNFLQTINDVKQIYFYKE